MKIFMVKHFLLLKEIRNKKKLPIKLKKNIICTNKRKLKKIVNVPPISF